MRLISDEALDLIAGGSSEASIPSVTIVGYVSYGSDSGGGGWGGYGAGPGSAAVSTPDPQPEPPLECPAPVHSSPDPANCPKDVDMNTLRNTMLDVAAYIKTMDPGIEHGALVLRASNGTLRVGEVRHGTEDSVDMSTYPLQGEVIVGYIHSHPDNGIDQTRPSTHDFDAAAELRTSPVADPALMLYVLDDKSGDVFEYGADTPRNTTKTGANITDDTSQPCG
jgi:hypothetical protein